VVGCVTSAPVVTVDELEAYRRLRTLLPTVINDTGSADDRGRVLVLASAAGEVDTATVASNLARAMGLAGSRDCAGHHPPRSPREQGLTPSQNRITPEMTAPEIWTMTETTTSRCMTTRPRETTDRKTRRRSRGLEAARTGVPTRCP
jgi:Mrp family chromosome partitioning ATPase